MQERPRTMLWLQTGCLKQLELKLVIKWLQELWFKNYVMVKTHINQRIFIVRAMRLQE